MRYRLWSTAATLIFQENQFKIPHHPLVLLFGLVLFWGCNTDDRIVSDHVSEDASAAVAQTEPAAKPEQPIDQGATIASLKANFQIAYNEHREAREAVIFLNPMCIGFESMFVVPALARTCILDFA